MTDHGRNGAILLETELKNDMIMNTPQNLICYNRLWNYYSK